MARPINRNFTAFHQDRGGRQPLNDRTYREDRLMDSPARIFGFFAAVAIVSAGLTYAAFAPPGLIESTRTWKKMSRGMHAAGDFVAEYVCDDGGESGNDGYNRSRRRRGTRGWAGALVEFAAGVVFEYFLADSIEDWCRERGR